MSITEPKLKFLDTEPRLFIGGEWVSTGSTLPTVNPASGEVLTEVPVAGEAEVGRRCPGGDTCVPPLAGHSADTEGGFAVAARRPRRLPPRGTGHHRGPGQRQAHW